LLNPDRRPFAPRRKVRKEIDLEDEARFLKSWIESPLKTGAVAPSGKVLARRMAQLVDPMAAGPVVELGPGTGPVTQALLQRGVAPERLFLVEYSADFAKLLRQKYPGVTVIQGDAYALKETLRGHVSAPASAIVSSLPLLTRPEAQRTRLLEQAFGLMERGAPFIQFTYKNASPVPLGDAIEASVSERIWKNLPPARIWTYRQPA
jgi:phosphatidylethanolamine/phosphatidyl-N-methylethanolamine N-methyltransferase